MVIDRSIGWSRVVEVPWLSRYGVAGRVVLKSRISSRWECGAYANCSVSRSDSGGGPYTMNDRFFNCKQQGFVLLRKKIDWFCKKVLALAFARWLFLPSSSHDADSEVMRIEAVKTFIGDLCGSVLSCILLRK